MHLFQRCLRLGVNGDAHPHQAIDDHEQIGCQPLQDTEKQRAHAWYDLSGDALTFQMKIIRTEQGIDRHEGQDDEHDDGRKPRGLPDIRLIAVDLEQKERKDRHQVMIDEIGFVECADIVNRAARHNDADDAGATDEEQDAMKFTVSCQQIKDHEERRNAADLKWQ